MAHLPIIATCAVLMLSGLTGAHAALSQAPAPSAAVGVTIDGVHLLGPFHLRATPVDPLMVSPFVVPPCGDKSESPAEMLFEGTATLDGTRCVDEDGFDALLSSEAAPTHTPLLGVDVPF